MILNCVKTKRSNIELNSHVYIILKKTIFEIEIKYYKHPHIN